jgi:hypothetical protein
VPVKPLVDYKTAVTQLTEVLTTHRHPNLVLCRDRSPFASHIHRPRPSLSSAAVHALALIDPVCCGPCVAAVPMCLLQS